MKGTNLINYQSENAYIEVTSITDMKTSEMRSMENKESSCSYYHIIKDPVDEQILFIRPFIKFRDGEML